MIRINKRKREKMNYYLDYYFMDKLLKDIEQIIQMEWRLDIKIENGAPDSGTVYIKKREFKDEEQYWHELYHIHCSDMFCNEVTNYEILAKKIHKEVDEYLESVK